MDRISYADARRRREAAKAHRAELQLAELFGELVRADAQHQVLSRWDVVCRERLLNFALRLAPVLAEAADPVEVHRLIHDEMCETLRYTATAPRIIDELVRTAVTELQRSIR